MSSIKVDDDRSAHPNEHSSHCDPLRYASPWTKHNHVVMGAAWIGGIINRIFLLRD